MISSLIIKSQMNQGVKRVNNLILEESSSSEGEDEEEENEKE